MVGARQFPIDQHRLQQGMGGDLGRGLDRRGRIDDLDLAVLEIDHQRLGGPFGGPVALDAVVDNQHPAIEEDPRLGAHAASFTT